MKLYLLWVRYWFTRLGWPLITGSALLLMSVIAYFALNLPLQYRIQQQQIKNTAFARLARTEQLDTRQQLALSTSPDALLNIFYGMMPGEGATEQSISTIFDAAFESDLVVQQANYKRNPIKDTTIVEYQIELPVTGTYPNISKFINRVLYEHPSAMLDSLKMSRQDAIDHELDAKLHFTLLLKGAK